MRPGTIVALSIVWAGCAAAPSPEPASTSTAVPEPTATFTPMASREPTMPATQFTSPADFTPISGACPVSLAAGEGPLPAPYNDFNFGNEDNTLLTIPWPDGTILFEPGGPGFTEPDGALAMKWPWYRNVRGKLTISGRRLDAPAPPLRSEVNDGYSDFGFQPCYLIFPTDGCWEVTGAVGEARLTFVTRVVNTR